MEPIIKNTADINKV